MMVWNYLKGGRVMNLINWQFCDNPNEINEVLLNGGDQDWEGLTDASQIINIFYFEGHRNYMVFWANEALKAKMDGDMGEVSDGYHTFNQLYHQRAVLFATIVKQNKEKAWKSWKHGDGKFCFDSNKEWFIVGVDTPEGSYTYHYEKKYWGMFDCVELERGKFWDGHTEDDVTRLLSLQSADSNANQHVGSVDLISRQDAIDVVNSLTHPSSVMDVKRKLIEIPSADAVQIPIKLEKRYPQSRDEDITDAFMRGYLAGRSSADRPPGKWKQVIPANAYECSKCGQYVMTDDIEVYKFCHGCGADMRGEEE